MPEVFGSSLEGRALFGSLLARRGRRKALREAIWPLIARHDHPESYDKQFQRYRDEIRFPTAAYVWALGEGLRRTGIGWMRGTIMLYAYGLHEDLVGVYATAGADLVPHKSWFLYEALNLPAIAGYSPLDPVLQPDDEYELLRFSARSVKALHAKFMVPLPPGTLADETVFLGNRQTMRIALADPPREYVALLNRAWRRWKRDAAQSVFSEEVLDAYDTVRSNNIPPERRSKRLGEQLWHWFACLEAENRPPHDEEDDSDATDDHATDTAQANGKVKNPTDPFEAVSDEVVRLTRSSRRGRVRGDPANELFRIKPASVYPRRKYDGSKSR